MLGDREIVEVPARWSAFGEHIRDHHNLEYFFDGEWHIHFTTCLVPREVKYMELSNVALTILTTAKRPVGGRIVVQQPELAKG